MLGDVAVMVHPEDERYTHLIGKMVKLPLCDREIPIIADDYVDQEFGTGVVKVTPAHDFNDYAVGQRHKLPHDQHPDAGCQDQRARASEISRPGPLRRAQADRRRSRSAGLFEKTEKHKLKVPRGDRTGVVIEPMLTDQWFVAMSKPGSRRQSPSRNRRWNAWPPARSSSIPENWVNTYNQWLNNIQDWCISRQLWWGHQIPAGTATTAKCYVAHDEAEATPAGRQRTATPAR